MYDISCHSIFADISNIMLYTIMTDIHRTAVVTCYYFTLQKRNHSLHQYPRHQELGLLEVLYLSSFFFFKFTNQVAGRVITYARRVT